MLKFNRSTLVTITAPTCSGKNYLLEGIERTFGWNRIVSTTTRGIRKGEVEGKDYYFITDEESRSIEKYGRFAELIEFRGIRYGVTSDEMGVKMNQDVPPMVILEPQGLAMYKKMCFKEKWDVFTVYVSTVEEERIRRLNERTAVQLQAAAIDRYEAQPMSILNRGNGFDDLEKIVKQHTDRLLSITTEERRWSNSTEWNVIAPGDNLSLALEYIKLGVKRRNVLTSTPTPYKHNV